MPEAFTLGPLLIPTRIAAFVVAVFVALWIASRLAVRSGADATWTRQTCAGSALAGLITARIAYVALNWNAFALEPWTALYIWQPGYLLVAGLAGGALYVLYRLRSQAADRRLPHLRAISTGFAVGATLLATALISITFPPPSGVAGSEDKVQDFELVNLDGERVALSDLQGKGVVLNFWATWCPPCRREMPLLESIWLEYRSKGIVIVGVDVGESPKMVRSFIDTMGITYPVWTNAGSGAQDVDDTNEIFGRFGGVGLPTTVFIDPDRIIEDIYVGELNRAVLVEQLTGLLPE
ncbi:MAG: Thiol-disulfide oxidoreductase ResA [Gammaproteobacteria bacterium]|nr:Thiol-disulfide oxidoreductase ResA [Gammaproteobacteria bacterium]